MNKINKIILICCFMFIITGCTVNYEVEIYDDEVRENFTFIETNTNLLNSKYTENMIFYQDYTYKGIIEEEYKNNTSVFRDGVEKFYKKKKITKNGLGINYKYDYSIANFSRSIVGNASFKHFNVLANDDTYIISTSKGTTLFENYKYLNTVTVHLKTNHKVKESNADRVDKYHYYWDINEANYKDKSIYIELYKDKYVFNYDNKVTKTLIVVGIIAILILTVIIVLRRKAIKNNEI